MRFVGSFLQQLRERTFKGSSIVTNGCHTRKHSSRFADGSLNAAKDSFPLKATHILLIRGPTCVRRVARLSCVSLNLRRANRDTLGQITKTCGPDRQGTIRRLDRNSNDADVAGDLNPGTCFLFPFAAAARPYLCVAHCLRLNARSMASPSRLRDPRLPSNDRETESEPRCIHWTRPMMGGRCAFLSLGARR